jgi:hypothetical protein
MRLGQFMSDRSERASKRLGTLFAAPCHFALSTASARAEEAIAVARRYRAQLRTTIPDRFQAITRAPRPTLTPLPITAVTPAS